jgi:hypothetical protein
VTRRGAVYLLVLTVLLARLPWLGVVLAGRDPAPYAESLPRAGLVEHAPFSWLVCALLLGALFGLLGWVAWRLLRATAPAPATPPSPPPTRSWPWWGWVGVTLIGAGWVLAWTRLSWFAALQPYTYTPLWVGFVLALNAWVERRTGTCPLRAPGFRGVVLLSAVFWWYFEYLNRFVESWDYSQTPSGPLDIFLHGTLPFATVLPAVASAQALLASWPRFLAAFARGPVLAPRRPRLAAGAALTLSVAGLLGLGLAPNQLFWLLWLAPLGVLISLHALFGEEHVLRGLGRGDWRPVATWSLGALLCGGCWEMWNMWSLSRWTYAVPYVDGLHLFEMPLAGYLGYLPFGLECAVVAGLAGYRSPLPASGAAQIDLDQAQ